MSALTVVGSAAPASAAFPDCTKHTVEDRKAAKAFCARNGEAWMFRLVIKCENTSWNPWQRGDTYYKRGGLKSPGQTAKVWCGDQHTAAKVIWKNVIITRG